MHNKKRKHDDESTDTFEQHTIMKDDETSILLHDEMTLVNNQLISLMNKIALVDHEYFLMNCSMVDEFVGNVHEFLKQFDFRRKKVSFSKLNSDILMNVYQFLDTSTLKNCGLVAKLWNDALIGLRVVVRREYVEKLLNSSLLKSINGLELFDVQVDAFKSLSNCKNLDQFKYLKLYCKQLDVTCVEYLKKCHIPNLNELQLGHSRCAENAITELLNSFLVNSIKKLDLGYCLQDVSNACYRSISQSKYLNQITHLTIQNTRLQKWTSIDLFQKHKPNLEFLTLKYYDLTKHPNLFTGLKNLTYLDIGDCEIAKQELEKVFTTLPRLTTLKAKKLTIINIQTAATPLLSNSQISITELDLNNCDFSSISYLIYNCPKLKILDITLWDEMNEKSTVILPRILKSPNLSNVECLTATYDPETMEIIFTNPIFSNLKNLKFETDFYIDNLNLDLMRNCTNLVNLVTLDFDFCVSKDVEIDCDKALKNNPIFSKLLISLKNHF